MPVNYRWIRAAQANGVGMPATGQVHPSYNLRPSLLNSFWEESYDLPQWFTPDTPKTDSSESSSFLGLPPSSISANRVEIPDGPISPDAPLSGSPATDTVTRVQAIAATLEPPSITLDDIRAVQAVLKSDLHPVKHSLQTKPDEAVQLKKRNIHEKCRTQAKRRASTKMPV